MKTFDRGLAHPSAIIEDGVQLGEGTRVWDGVHIRRNARSHPNNRKSAFRLGHALPFS